MRVITLLSIVASSFLLSPCGVTSFTTPTARPPQTPPTTAINHGLPHDAISRLGRRGRRNNSFSLAASSMKMDDKPELFKAGLLANVEAEAATLASKRIRSVQDLGWKGPAKRRGNTRPRHWAFGGAGEKAVQDKPNYDPSGPNCVERWVGLSEFYAIVKDDTALADTIFVALAKGGAYIERDVAEGVIARWRRSGSKSFDVGAFMQTVQEGRRDFLIGWAAFLTLTGIAVAGIVFPTNPLQLALVDLLEVVTGPDTNIPK